MVVLQEKLWDCYEIDVPLNQDLIILIGENGSGKTHTLNVLERHFQREGKRVVYIKENRLFCHTKQEASELIKQYQDKLRLRKLLNVKSLDFLADQDINIEKISFDQVLGQPIRGGFLQLLHVFCLLAALKEDTVLLYDECENNLSLTYQSSLIQFLQHFPWVKQIILTTHAPSIIADHTKAVVSMEEIIIR